MGLCRLHLTLNTTSKTTKTEQNHVRRVGRRGAHRKTGPKKNLQRQRVHRHGFVKVPNHDTRVRRSKALSKRQKTCVRSLAILDAFSADAFETTFSFHFLQHSSCNPLKTPCFCSRANTSLPLFPSLFVSTPSPSLSNTACPQQEDMATEHVCQFVSIMAPPQSPMK